MYISFAVSLILFLIPKLGITAIGAIPLQELAVDILAVGAIFAGLSSSKSLREGKNIELNRFLKFAGFFGGVLFLLIGILRMIGHLFSI
jgi:hypothetical protein